MALRLEIPQSSVSRLKSRDLWIANHLEKEYCGVTILIIFQITKIVFAVYRKLITGAQTYMS